MGGMSAGASQQRPFKKVKASEAEVGGGGAAGGGGQLALSSWTPAGGGED